MKHEIDDYQSDIQFGDWLKKLREQKGLTLEAAAREIVIDRERLKALEMGSSKHGVTRSECIRMSRVYGASLDQLLAEASRE